MGLKWAHYFRVMLLVPLDQGTQGNKGRKGISLQCDRVSLYRYNAVLSYVEDEFQESETIQIITGLDSSVITAIVS